MNVMGFHEAYESALTFTLENSKQFKVVSLAGLVILKLVAWSERNIETNKDAEDLLFILSNYNNFNPAYLFEENSDLLTSKDFDFATTGAIILARHVLNIIKPNIELKEKLITILSPNLKSIDACKLIKNSSTKINDFSLLSSFNKELSK